MQCNSKLAIDNIIYDALSLVPPFTKYVIF